MGERREPKAGDTAEQTTGLDPITGLGRGVAALVIGKSAGERESVARALHRAHHGADGAFLRIQGAQEEQLFRQAIESWLAPPTGGSPRLLDRNEDGSEAWKGQLITGSERSLHGAVKEGRFDENLALRLERVRIVLDPEQAGPDR